MRLYNQSTRTTIRTLTLLFALTSLLLTMMTPFVGTAQAEGNFKFAGFILLDNGDELDLGDPNDPGSWTESGQDVAIDGYKWSGNTDGTFHLSCSATLVGTEVTVESTGDIVTIIDFAIHRENAKNASAPLDEKCTADTFADLDLTKTASTSTVSPGDTLTYDVTVENVASGEGATTAVNVVLTDSVPAPFEVTAASNGCTFTGNDVTCDAGNLDLGESFTTTISVSVPEDAACGPTENVASAVAGNAAPDESAPATVTISDCPEPPATITLEKVVDGDDIAESDFQASLNDGNVDWGATTEVQPGDHTIAEAIASGSEVQDSWYEAGDWSCDNGDSGDADGATVSVGSGDDVTCTITNTQLPTTLTLHKVLPNDNGGTATQDEFQAYIDGSEVDWDVANDVSALVEHTASEDTVPGYVPGVWTGDCDEEGNVTLEPGEHGECTITNDDDPPSVTVLKDVTNDDGGVAEPEDFELLVDGSSRAHGDTVVVSANDDVTIGETELDGYELTDIQCTDGTELADGEDTVTLNLGVGEDVTCTVFNDDEPPFVIVGDPLITATTEPVCDTDAAYLTYEATTENVDSETITIHWFDANGVEQHTDVVEGLSGQVLWPGAEVDGDGFATDWPGFVFDGEVWEEGDDGFGWANGEVTVTFEVNPTTNPITVTYPSDSGAADGEDCLPPEVEVAGEQFEQPAPAAKELPRTGLDTAAMALWAALMAGLGMMILLATGTPTATVRQRR